MRTLTLRIVIAAMATAALMTVVDPATVTLAQGPEDDDWMGRGPRPGVERMTQYLDLTPEQEEAVAKIRDEGRQERLARGKELMRLRHELRGEMLQDEPSESTAQKLTEQIGDLLTQQRQSRLTQRLAIRKQLTPEQRDKMLLWQEHRHHRGRGGDRHGTRWGAGHYPRRECDGRPRYRRDVY